jgi:hypothetical protein
MVVDVLEETRGRNRRAFQFNALDDCNGDCKTDPAVTPLANPTINALPVWAQPDTPAVPA